MSGRMWRPAGPGRARAGGIAWGMAAFRSADGYTAQAWWASSRTAPRRHMSDGPMGTIAEAKAAACRWLDEREAEAQQAQKGGTT